MWQYALRHPTDCELCNYNKLEGSGTGFFLGGANLHTHTPEMLETGARGGGALFQT